MVIAKCSQLFWGTYTGGEATTLAPTSEPELPL